MTVNKLIEQYLDLKTNLAVSTKENYTHIYEKNIKDLLIGLCAIMMVISVALYIIQNTRTLKGETV